MFPNFRPLQIVSRKDRTASSLTVQPPAVVASNPAFRGMADIMNEIVNEVSKDATKGPRRLRIRP
jgi:hypothetical protein